MSEWSGMPYLRLLRPEQWTKNVFLFAGAAFGQKLLRQGQPQWDVWGLVLLGFICFCVLSSAVYILNDAHDRDEDKLHPRKRLRPIASGQVTPGAARAYAVLLLVAGLAGAWWLDAGRGFFVIAGAYVLLQMAYTWWLKHATLLDVIAIGLGFVLRAVAGAVLVHVPISPWLILCTFTLCLFLGFSKRRCELDTLTADGSAALHRRTLAEYTPDLLNHMTTLAAAVAVVSFMLYATDRRTTSVEDGIGTNLLVYTLPLVVFAIFRFALLVEHGRVDGPTAVVLRDRPFQAAVLLWVIAALAIVYWGRDLDHWLRTVLHGTAR